MPRTRKSSERFLFTVTESENNGAQTGEEDSDACCHSATQQPATSLHFLDG